MFCINYFPLEINKKNKECHDIAERLYECLEWLDVGDNLLRGIGLKHDILDGVLNFYVNYNSFEYKPKGTTPMGEVVKNLRVWTRKRSRSQKKSKLHLVRNKF